MKQRSFLKAFLDGFLNLGEGIASAFSFGLYTPRTPSYEEQFGTDAEQLASDWRTVGNDMRTVMQKFENKLPQDKK